MWKQVDENFWKENRESKIDEVTAAVQDIIDLVRFEGDKALFDLALKFDKAVLKDLEVSRDEIEEAYENVDPVLLDELENAAEFIQRFHELQVPEDLWLKEIEPGITLGVKSTPLERVGCYIPGGRAPYASTALMCIIPARVAGVGEVICCTPPSVDPVTLVAMDIAGADEIYKVGGAQAIAAMALGTESIERVQKIVGPGNVYVTAAKTMLRKNVEIDFPAGPSEIGVLADETADAEFIAADIIAQAEHDPSSACLLVATDAGLPGEVWSYIEKQMAGALRREIITSALKNSGYIVEEDIELAAEIMNGIAPEHLSIQVRDPLEVLSRTTNAGSIFIGPYSPVAAGDYASGTNHVLPTAGHAATMSGLNVGHFRKTSTVQILSRDGLAAIAPTIIAISEAEGFHAHAESVRIRGQKKE
ncbi:MAG: histidinol dehydrogenase [Candidatus Methanoplasma sp.]|jgi:histidinol dehydrogenase|nr:histidinol dehydrogenase [Candidatus Methanoplasma sp.]